jgi:putative tryptophan/tyrosine transport system substrate-binding protein
MFAVFRFITTISFFLCLVVTIPDAKSQQTTAKVARIGYLGVAPRPTDEVFVQELRKLGYREEENVRIEYHWGGNNMSKTTEAAEGLARSKVDVIVAVASPATRAAKLATTSIPIVFADVGDPVAYGFVKNLNRPDGNLTGLSGGLSGMGPKALEMLKELVPKAKRVAVLGNPSNPGNEPAVASLRAVAPALDLALDYVSLQQLEDFDRVFDELARTRPDGLFVIPDNFLFTQRERIIAFASSQRIPAAYGIREYVPAGGLFALGANRHEMYRRLARYVDKILKGAKPGDLPIEEPMRFELLINLKSAKAIGLEVPPTLLAQAEELID